jgi:hypothetical protein
MEGAKTFGAQLFNAVLDDDHVWQAYYDARQTADTRERGLRLTLHLTNVPELMEIPWEFLYESRQFHSQSIYMRGETRDSVTDGSADSISAVAGTGGAT